ncbi:MAG: ABC transporter substrate-binding protein [Clostridia bacterium]|nr:ABC transporter substrate-binding protein [Clostridia bacterium]
MAEIVKTSYKIIVALFTAICMLMLTLAGCGGNTGNEMEEGGAPEISGLAYESELQLERATEFSVYHYEGGYDLIDIHEGDKFLLVPEGGKVPESVPEGITVLQKPVDKIYLAATATMAMFCSCDALDHIRMSSIKENDWSFDEPREAMANGKIIYAGRYSTPDYETLFDEECDLAIESTMIYHTPEVKEMIEKLDVPVLVDRSSYEEDPMGRAEWIKLYGVLTDHQEEANAFFDEQMQKLKDLDDFENTEKTVAFFYLTADGKVVVRKSTDYVPKMIEIAGARYAFSDLEDDSDRTSVDMSVETFYATAVDADYIIYNGSIDGSVKTMEDLLAKDPVMKELKAVKDNKCWVTGDSMYQRTDIIADLILDFHKAFTEDDPSDLQYLQKLQ